MIVQADMFDGTASITICAFTTDPTEAPLFRLRIAPSEANGLATVSRLMVDKVTTAPKGKLGRLADTDLVRLDRAILLFFDRAGEPVFDRAGEPAGSTAS